MYELYVQGVPADLRAALTLEYELYRITQMYHCTRSEAVREMDWADLVPVYDSWGVRMAEEFSAMEVRLRNKQASR